MLLSFAVAVMICFFAGTVIVFMTLAAQSRTDDSIARVLYDTERPTKSR